MMMNGFLGHWINEQLGPELTPGELLKRTGRRIGEVELMTRSAAIAFYAFSALVPFIVVLLTFLIVLMPPISLSSGSSEAELSGQVMHQLQEAIKRALPGSAVRVVENQIARIQQEPPYGLLSIGLIMSFYLASSVFLQVITALNRIYGLEETRPRWKLYFTAISMTALEATILIASLLTIVLWPQLATYLQWTTAQSIIATIIQWVAVTGAVLLSFFLALYLGPTVRPSRKWITPGSVLGTVAFLLMSLLFRFYVQHYGTYDQTYGSLGGIVVLLLWIQMIALILLVAAQINQVICASTSSTPVKDGCPPLPSDNNGNRHDDLSQARDLHYEGQALRQDFPQPRQATSLEEPSTMSVDSQSGRSDRSSDMTARDVMNDEFRTCGRFSKVMEAVLIFREADCGMVPVTEEGKPVGVVTDRDVALALARDGMIAEQPVSEIMNTEIVSVSPDSSLSQIVQEFRSEGVRRLLVVNGEGVLEGVISWSDVVKNLPDIVTGQMVNDIVNQP